MTTYPFVQSATDLGPAKGPRLAMLWHMAEGGGTVAFLSKPNVRGVSVHFVIEYSGRIVQMLNLDHMHSSLNPHLIRLGNDPAYAYGGETVVYGRAAAVSVLGEWADISHGKPGPNHATIAVEIEGFQKDGPNAAQAAAIHSLAAYVGIAAHLGHRDFQDYKECPGHRFPWGQVGGHGKADDMKQLPITDTTPHMVDIPAPVTFYNLDGSVQSEGHTAQVNAYSPYIAASAPDHHFYAIYRGPDPVTLVLTRPKAARVIPPPSGGDIAHAVTLAIDGTTVYEGTT